MNDLAYRFLNRKPLKSCRFEENNQTVLLQHMRHLVETVGYNPDYYTAVHSSFDLPYDFYRPESNKHRTQIELQEKDGSLVELSKVSQLVKALAGEGQGDHRFYFPKEMVDLSLQDNYDLFGETYKHFASHIHNGALIN